MNLSVLEAEFYAWEEFIGVNNKRTLYYSFRYSVVSDCLESVCIKISASLKSTWTKMELTAASHSVHLSDGNKIPLIGIGTYGDPRQVQTVFTCLRVLVYTRKVHFVSLSTT